jgi:hypothetical protein
VRHLQQYGVCFTRLCKIVRGSRHEEGKIARWVEGLLAKFMADERESMGLPHTLKKARAGFGPVLEPLPEILCLIK